MSLKHVVGRASSSAVVALCGLAVFVQFSVHGALSFLPESRQIDWSETGIPGGIPLRTVVSVNVRTNGAVGNGIADDTQAIQNAINTAGHDEVVYLPAGTYRLTSTLKMRNHVVLRGAAMGETMLVMDFPGTGIAFNWPYWYWQQTNVSGSLTRGATSMTLAGIAPDLRPGMKVMLEQQNDPNLVDANGIEGGPGDYSMGQLVQVSSVSGKDIAFTPAVYWNYKAELAPRIRFPVQYGQSENLITDAGLESLTISNKFGNADANISMLGATRCWVKGVRTMNAAISHLRLEFSFRCEFTEMLFEGVSPPYSSGRLYGIQIGSGPPAMKTTACRFENNIFTQTRGPILGYGAAGNVFAYNLLTNLFDDTAGVMKMAISVHSAHPMMNLFEGNVCTRFNADFFHGSSSHQTLFRNWFYGREPQHRAGMVSVELDMKNRYYNVIGNVLGYPGIGQDVTSIFEEAVPAPSRYDIYRVWQLGYLGEGGGLEGWIRGVLFKGDPEVKNTLIRHGNYDYLRNTTAWDPNISDHTLPASLYLNSRPDWWPSTLPWPAIGPDLAPKTGRIPAQVRFAQPVSAKPVPPSNLRRSQK